MCGIIGYLGEREAQPVLINGLKKLEYRGYDSAGIAVMGDAGLGIEKMAGKISELEDSLVEKPRPGKVGIGHTRWATHGEPNDVNAHPHRGCGDEYSLVHNGIIENHRKLRSKLEAGGHEFSSDTDSEVIIHLIEEETGSLEEKVRSALRRLEGTFAIAVLSQEHPDRIVGARRGSPLVVGSTENEKLIASDVPAMLDYTKDITYLEDDQVVSLSESGMEITDLGATRRKPLPGTSTGIPLPRARKATSTSC